MKRSLITRFVLVLLTCLGLVSTTQTSQAQILVELGGGAGATYTWGQYIYPNPLMDYWWSIRSRYFIKASEMQFHGVTPGQITSLAFKVRNATPFTARAVNIYMQQTTAAALTNPQTTTGMTLVHSQTGWQIPLIVGTPTWVTFNFQTPFMWDGTSNLLIDFCTYRTAYAYVFPEYEYTTPQPIYATSSFRYGDGANYCASDQTGTGYAIRPTMRFGILSGIETSFPEDIDPRRILRQGSIYDGSDPAFPKPSLSFRQTNGQNITLTYRLVGPLPSTNVVYEARRFGNPSIAHTAANTSLFKYEMTEAVGPLAGVNGALDCRFAAGGAYRLEATYSIPGYTQSWQREFNIAFPNDLAVRTIRSPLAIPRKYPRGVTVPISGIIQNVGLNNVTSARCVATVNQLPSGVEVYRDTVEYTGDLATGAQANIDFDNFVSQDVSQFSVTICAELLNAADQQAANDCQPTSGQHIFQTLYNEEVGAQAIEVPSSNATYYSKRPFTPRGRIVNGGMQDLSNIPVRLQIYQLPQRTMVYNQVVVVPDVGAEVPLNISSFDFPAFTPQAAGQFEACLTTEYPGDPVPGNNQVCQQFSVQPALEGVYTIGTLKQGDPRNYTSFQLAVNDLFLKGVSGPVEFQLTDASYAVGSTALASPALDLTSRIIGMDQTNTVTFKPSLEQSVAKGSITVTLNTGSGVGILFGQTILSSNPNAIQFQFQRDPQWANSAGNFIFDGGSQKSIVFELNAPTPFRAPFYLGDGSRDIKLRNLIIRNSTAAAPSYLSSLPSINFVNNTFTYQNDVRSTTLTYSAGIVSRQKLPLGRNGNNSERLDTIPGQNNEYANNEISGFGYGIVSMGVGVAVKGNEYRGYYSTGTKITGNLITNCRTAGVFVGYETGAVIRANRIHSIGTIATGGTGVDAAGIVAGGFNRYNNIGLTIDRNEISGVVADVFARGVSIEQVRNSFPSVTAGGNTYFPNAPEASSITNNMIWGLRRQTTTTNVAGIHLFTQRSTTLTGLNQLLTASLNNNQYFTRNDVVYNNTIVMPNDNIVGSGLIAGVGIQHASGATVKNNVFIMQGPADAASTSHSAMFYQGLQMTDGNDPMALVSDRNAFELGNSSAIRFVEINNNSDIISAGSADEFRFLSQWKAWTRRDINSVEGSFFADMFLDGIAPNQRLRVKTTPAPIGSLLNNRGERLAAVTSDIDGNRRGEAGQPFDIGADEFDGRQYVKDLEAVSVVKPSVYRSATGVTSDAEYIMTRSPISVTGLVRNSGGLPQTNTPIRMRIYMETAASNNAALVNPQFSTSPVADRVINTTINSGAEVNVVYDLTWEPQSYRQLSGLGFVVPANLDAMRDHVTPRYKIEISVSSDEFTPNNITSKVVRFYMARSPKRMLTSVRGASVNLLNGTPTANQIAARLNADSLSSNLDKVGYSNDAINDNISYDVIDRDNFEERAIDYTLYRTLFWSSDNNPLSRFERRDLRAYVASGTPSAKRNLAMAGQNYPRQHVGLDVINDQSFVQSVLRVRNDAPGNPIPTSGTYHGRRVRGDALARGLVETVSRTGFTGDADPLPALVELYSDPTVAGVAQRAYNYVLGDRQTTDSIMGSATASLLTNVIYLGVDWRHWQHAGVRTGTERVLRGIFDFFESNGGGVVSVELTSFDAKARGNNVDVMWNTISEKNSDHFSVERADVMAGNAANATFVAVGSVQAAGQSVAVRDYSFRDLGLAPGRYTYRLVSVDKDGSSTLSHEVDVEVATDGRVTTLAVAPQPARSSAQLTITAPEGGSAVVEIIDAAGARVRVMNDVVVTKGTQSLDLPIETLASGTYTVLVTVAGSTQSTQFVVAR